MKLLIALAARLAGPAAFFDRETARLYGEIIVRETKAAGMTLKNAGRGLVWGRK